MGPLPGARNTKRSEQANSWRCSPSSGKDRQMKNHSRGARRAIQSALGTQGSGGSILPVGIKDFTEERTFQLGLQEWAGDHHTLTEQAEGTAYTESGISKKCQYFWMAKTGVKVECGRRWGKDWPAGPGLKVLVCQKESGFSLVAHRSQWRLLRRAVGRGWY